MKIEIAGSSGLEASEETGSLLPPSPTRVRTTLRVAFRAILSGEQVELALAL